MTSKIVPSIVFFTAAFFISIPSYGWPMDRGEGGSDPLSAAANAESRRERTDSDTRGGSERSQILLQEAMIQICLEKRARGKRQVK